MSKRKGINLTKLKSKIENKSQETISKFFSPATSSSSTTKPSGTSKSTNQIGVKDVIEIEDSPEKHNPTLKKSGKKRTLQDDNNFNSSSKKLCTDHDQKASDQNYWDELTCTPKSLKVTEDKHSETPKQPSVGTNYTVNESTLLKLKQFESGQEFDKNEDILEKIKSKQIISLSDSFEDKQEVHGISDSDEEMIAKESNLSRFSRPEQNVTKSKGKSPLMKTTKTKYTPLEQQFLDIKKKYPDALLLMECGYRYRMFGDDAEEAAKVLKIFAHPDHNFMTASIPTHRLFVHVRRLVSAGFKVGVVKQTETAALKAAGDNRNAPFSRELHSLYTKSTLIGEDVNPISGEVTGDINVEEQTSFLLCIYESPTEKSKDVSIGLLAVQPSTGDIIYDCFHDNEMRSELETRITHIQPAEVLVPKDLTEKTEKIIKGIVDISMIGDDRIRLERQSQDNFEYDQAFKNVSEFFKSDEKCAGRMQEIINLPKSVISCLSVILNYLKDFGLSRVLKLTGNFCQFSTKSLYMQLPSNVLRNLEIFQNLTDGKEKGSLFWAINHTTTKFGARMLRSWLRQPLLSARQILARQEAVHEFIEGDNSAILNQLKSSLSQSPDLEKGISSIYFKKCSVLEFYLVCKSLVKWSEDIQQISKQLNGSLSSEIVKEILDDIPDLLSDVQSLLNNINSNNVRDKDKTNLFSDESLFPSVKQRKQEIEDINKEMLDHRRTVRLTLKQPALDYVTVLGTEYLVEVKNNCLHVVPKDWLKISSTKAVSRFHPPFVLATYKRLNQLREQLKRDCEEAWIQFLGWFEDGYAKYRKAVDHIATLDCLFSMAFLAGQDGFCRPTIEEDKVCINIEQGRHLVIQQILTGDQQFVPNDTRLSGDGQRVMVITGPNMGGKSSYIKQVAIIAILTQTGSYVPAQSAQMGILDAVYTRMGAMDEIYKGRSTFMVELSEASDIMGRATKRSLVILDELGRGTSTHDGVAIAYSTLDYFINEIKCLTLFVTHYTVMSEFEDMYPGVVKNHHMSFMVNSFEDDNNEEGSDAVTFLYQLVQGCAGKSYGLNVARLASIPSEIVQRAAEKSKQFQETVLNKKITEDDFRKIFFDIESYRQQLKKH